MCRKRTKKPNSPMPTMCYTYRSSYRVPHFLTVAFRSSCPSCTKRFLTKMQAMSQNGQTTVNSGALTITIVPFHILSPTEAQRWHEPAVHVHTSINLQLPHNSRMNSSLTAKSIATGFKSWLYQTRACFALFHLDYWLCSRCTPVRKRPSKDKFIAPNSSYPFKIYIRTYKNTSDKTTKER